MYKGCDIRNPDLRKGMTPDEKWRDHVRLTMNMLNESGIDTQQFAEKHNRGLTQAA